MPITWSPETRELHLRNDRVSYVMRVHDDGSLGHLALRGAARGGPAARRTSSRRGFGGFSNRVGDPVALEYPTTGGGDYRIPALTVEHADGSTVLDLAYVEHRIVAGQAAAGRKPACPATYVESDDEADTLDVTLADAVSGVAVDLALHDLPRPPGRRPQRPHPQRRQRRRPPRPAR